jgi:hypothetical protein
VLRRPIMRDHQLHGPGAAQIGEKQTETTFE